MPNRSRLTEERLKEAHEVYAEAGSYAKTAEICSERWGERVPRRTMTDWLKGNVPLSESVQKFREDWGPDECLDHLREIAEAHPEQIITRNYFRNKSEISESTWNRFFGTFQEYKRQAGITLSRHQHRHERQIAKHASVDGYRSVNIEKAGWEDKYARPDAATFQTVLIGTDLHDVDCDPFWRRTFIDTAKRCQPEKIILGGDLFDLPEFGKYSVDPREWDVIGRIKWVHEFLAELREVCPDAEITLIEGNHEFRLARHLAEATPAMKAILSDLHGFTISGLLGLDEYEINYVARADLATFTERDLTGELQRNWICSYDCLVTHHYPTARSMGFPGTNGHHHKHIVWPMFSPEFSAYEWHQLGCGHRRRASYTDGELWGLGFCLAHVHLPTKSVAFEYVDVREFAVIGGRFYQRTKDEAVLP